MDERNFITGLPADFEFYVEGRGQDLSELMSNLNGPIQVKAPGPALHCQMRQNIFMGGTF